ncbi:ArgE/DapE family deacylase [soil metagenome]
MPNVCYITETLQKLVQINSVNPSLESDGAGEKEIGLFIAGEMSAMGIQIDIDEPEPGRLNVIGTLRGSGGGKSLMLNAQTDTVGVVGMKNPFSGTIEYGKLYGRGSYDMKGSIAAILDVAKKLTEYKQKLNGDIVFSFVADEEYESLGAVHLAKKCRVDAAIVTEPTDLNICLAHRGFGVFKIVTEGKIAHGGKHRQGVDANTKMGLLLAELDHYSRQLPDQKKHPLCGEASIHVPLIEGGNSLFIYSNKCTIYAERRTLPGESKEEVLAELNKIIKKLEEKDSDFKASISCDIWRDPYEIDSASSIVSHLTKISERILENQARYIGHTWWEDSAIFGHAGIETVIIGPKGGGIHEDVEWVEIDSVKKLSEILHQTAIAYCT